MRTYRAQKSALTRAINSGDPHRVIGEADRFFGEYGGPGQPPLPDDWHRWGRAIEDARWQIARER